MPHNCLRFALSLATLVLSLEPALAFAGRPATQGKFGLTPSTTPIAMCGYTCRRGGRYIPGPPEVCYERGLEYCGPSRGGGGGGYGFYGGGYGGGGCRTVTIERDDGTVRRIRRCD